MNTKLVLTTTTAVAVLAVGGGTVALWQSEGGEVGETVQGRSAANGFTGYRFDESSLAALDAARDALAGHSEKVLEAALEERARSEDVEAP